jgi:hypothetical protein
VQAACAAQCTQVYVHSKWRGRSLLALSRGTITIAPHELVAPGDPGWLPAQRKADTLVWESKEQTLWFGKADTLVWEGAGGICPQRMKESTNVGPRFVDAQESRHSGLGGCGRHVSPTNEGINECSTVIR